MIRTQIQLTEDQARQLKEIAYEKNISMAELIRRQVDELITQNRGKIRQHQIEQAKEACGKYSSGKKDVSIHHDAYLSEDYSS